MAIFKKGQGISVDPSDGQQSTQMQNPPELTDTMSSLQITENIVQTECTTETPTPADEGEQEDLELEFPIDKLNMLHEKISSARWVVPVLPDQELECLLLASIELCKKGWYYYDYSNRNTNYTTNAVQGE